MHLFQSTNIIGLVLGIGIGSIDNFELKKYAGSEKGRIIKFFRRKITPKFKSQKMRLLITIMIN